MYPSPYISTRKYICKGILSWNEVYVEPGAVGYDPLRQSANEALPRGRFAAIASHCLLSFPLLSPPLSRRHTTTAQSVQGHTLRALGPSPSQQPPRRLCLPRLCSRVRHPTSVSHGAVTADDHVDGGPRGHRLSSGWVRDRLLDGIRGGGCRSRVASSKGARGWTDERLADDRSDPLGAQ